ncbi:hypothetical protein CNE_BB1p04170 (plasmid) [Cupriavidus necator N-1]|uniref:DUF1329 domain-containing protein n=1 Tax=Cupriavidus necator (strain ATCC 43291 / DSM 13513 / CCUG 52238 / LMG 8453 / N-1) TaxID=1042878 RepID=F8GWX1_CUPNN|nr:DUF1329 domain-containing protein [Cupriavidus necator]AEI81841.1 hypothetical protein CNE_BB1p04170 [Cupriavidus necator N-1]MDX6008168.1 DUF1329 domain-containing protein [Cupriavidus necator]
MNYGMKSIALTLAALGAGTAIAAIPAEEAKQLEGALTPFGAIKAGNKSGTIPEYTGVPLTPPASFDPKNPGYLPDPFASDKPLFSIDAKNMAQHVDKLAEGVKAMLARHPGYHLNVYPSRRTMIYPKYALDGSMANATNCKLENDNLTGCQAGVPFPIPRNGEEAIWNHLLAFYGVSSTYTLGSYVVDRSGRMTLMSWFRASEDKPYWDSSNKGDGSAKLLSRVRYDTDEPARSAGERLLLISPIDQKEVAPVYQYLPGQRRVKLSPDLAYDTPNPSSGGVSAMDEVRGFYGKTDRFNWKLIGKKEMYIPYNAYKTLSPECSEEKMHTKDFLNPACVRWELHRVWHIEATLKEGKRHIFSKRIMYIDEDSFGAGVYDGYDAAGNLYRTTQQLPYYVYSDPKQGTGMFSQPFVTYDLQTGAYGSFNHVAFSRKGQVPVPGRVADREYTPGALAGGGIR